MTEREQVIAELLYLKHDCLEGSATDETLDKAIALLKAQEPMVIKNSAGNGICPGCGRIIPAWSSPNHCGYCGQAVKWK